VVASAIEIVIGAAPGVLKQAKVGKTQSLGGLWATCQRDRLTQTSQSQA